MANKKAVGALFGKFLEGLAVGAANKHMQKEQIQTGRREQRINTALQMATDPTRPADERNDWAMMYELETGKSLPRIPGGTMNAGAYEGGAPQEPPPQPSQMTGDDEYLKRLQWGVETSAKIDKDRAAASASRALAEQRRSGGGEDKTIDLQAKLLKQEADNIRDQMGSLLSKDPISGKVNILDQAKYNELDKELASINQRYRELGLELDPENSRKLSIPGFKGMPGPVGQ